MKNSFQNKKSVCLCIVIFCWWNLLYSYHTTILDSHGLDFIRPLAIFVVLWKQQWWQNHRITESQNHRTLGVGRDLCGPSSPIPCKAGSPRAGCTGPCPGGSSISPEKETPQPLWATCSSAPSPSEGRSSSSCSDGTSYASVCARCNIILYCAIIQSVNQCIIINLLSCILKTIVLATPPNWRHILRRYHVLLIT